MQHCWKCLFIYRVIARLCDSYHGRTHKAKLCLLRVKNKIFQVIKIISFILIYLRKIFYSTTNMFYVCHVNDVKLNMLFFFYKSEYVLGFQYCLLTFAQMNIFYWDNCKTFSVINWSVVLLQNYRTQQSSKW